MRWCWVAVADLLAVILPQSNVTLSPAGINYEDEIGGPLQHARQLGHQLHRPCSWRMVMCSSDSYVSALGLPSQSLSGKLSPGIGNLTRLQSMLGMLKTLDMSDNQLTGSIPSSLGNLKNLNYFAIQAKDDGAWYALMEIGYAVMPGLMAYGLHMVKTTRNIVSSMEDAFQLLVVRGLIILSLPSPRQR